MLEFLKPFNFITNRIVGKPIALAIEHNMIFDVVQLCIVLWLGLDNGMARAKLNNPITYFTDYTGSLGMVYDIAWYNGTLFLGSNTGVFYFDVVQLCIVLAGRIFLLEFLDFVNLVVLSPFKMNS